MTPTSMTDRARLDLHARTMFTHDASDHLVAVNEPRARPAARFFLGWTRDALLWRARHDLPAELVAHLAGLVAGCAVPAALEEPPRCLPAIRAALAPITDEYSGAEYHFPPEPAALPPLADAELVAVTAGNAHVLARWLPEWIPDAAYPFPLIAVLVAGDAVSICGCARTPGRATSAGIETHPEFRGRAYAAHATAAWARAVAAQGIAPYYGHRWTNTASQRVATKLGLVRYAAAINLT
jgi:RimJ/RimL family protein N-acetyltransferase